MSSEIRPTDRFEKRGIGLCVTAGPDDFDGVINVGDTVTIDDNQYRVSGIGTTRTLTYPPKTKGYEFVVRPVKRNGE